MRKLSTRLAPFLVTLFVAVSCAGGETTSSSSGSGGESGTGNSSGSSGGKTGNSSGGATSSGGSTGSGGKSTSSGGAVGSGGSSVGSGGATVTGSGGATSGSGGSTTTGTGGTTVTGALTVVDGFASGGTWMGYAYTFVGPATGSKATIAPANFMAMTQLCANGTITADSTYASVAGMGWNINQAKATSATPTPTDTVATSGVGLSVNVGSVTGLSLAMGGGSQLRVQIKTATSDFCAGLPAAGSQSIPWASFNSKCWDTTLTGATAFTAGTAIKAVELVVPSSGTAVIGPFNFCLLDAHSY